MIEKTIEKITDFENRTEASLEHLDKIWNQKLKVARVTNMQKLKEYKRTLKNKAEIRKEERMKIIKKETKKMDKETEKNIKDMERICTEKRSEILKTIKNIIEEK